ncbi:hypothetical protein EYF80_063600 [Liparis tanakae]|nr:hypothetical protein EYF80_063600 [Liparis tanakae]
MVTLMEVYIEEELGMYQLLAERSTVRSWPLACSSWRMSSMLIQWLPSTGTTRIRLPLQ